MGRTPRELLTCVNSYELTELMAYHSVLADEQNSPPEKTVEETERDLLSFFGEAR
jgi:hypothetical protein